MHLDIDNALPIVIDEDGNVIDNIHSIVIDYTGDILTATVTRTVKQIYAVHQRSTLSLELLAPYLHDQEKGNTVDCNSCQENG